MKKKYYYHDLKNDDFSSVNINRITLPENYRYISNNPIYKTAELLLRCIAFPIVWLILKLFYLQRVKNKKVLKKAKGRGYFLYGNHTEYMLDAYNPSVLTAPRHAHIVVNPDAVSVKGLGTVVKMLGAVPVPTSVKGMRNYKESITELINKKRVVAIYPEAHIWPYYTDIRPLGTQSFGYPAELGVPSFTATNIYTQRKLKFIKFPKVVTYIDGPFYPDMTLPKIERKQKLRDDIYNAMKKRVDDNPKYEYREYIFVEDEKNSNTKPHTK